LQTFFFGIRIARVWIDPKHDIDVILRHFHPLHQGADSVAFAFPVGRCSAVMHLRGEVFQASKNQRQCRLQGGGIDELLPRFLRLGDAAPQAEDAGLAFLLINAAVGITVNEPREPLAQLAEVGVDRGQRRGLCGGLWGQPTPLFLGETLRVREQRGDLAPHRHSEPIGPYWGMLTEPCSAKAVRIRPEAAGVRVRPRLPVASTGAHAFPIVGIAPGLTLAEALEHRESAALGLPRMAAMLLPLGLDRGTHLGLHTRRDREGEPVFGRHLHRRDGAPGLEGAPPLGAEPRAQQFLPRLAQRGRAARGRMFSQAPHHTAVPHGLPGARHLAGPGAPATDLPDRRAVASHPVQHWADPPGFVGDDLLPCVPAARILRDRAVPIRRPAGAHAPRPPAPHAACHVGGAR
jgi:hypothetical protein